MEKVKMILSQVCEEIANEGSLSGDIFAFVENHEERFRRFSREKVKMLLKEFPNTHGGPVEGL